MFPMMGLFLVWIPVAGLLLASLLFFVRPLRFLATFAFCIPLFAGYSAIAGFWGLALALERAGFNRWLVALSCWLGLFAGLAMGGALGFALAFVLNHIGRRIAVTLTGK